MSFFGKNKNKIIVAIIVAAALFAAFFWGAPDKSKGEEKPVKVTGATVQTEDKEAEKEPEAEETAPAPDEKAEAVPEEESSPSASQEEPAAAPEVEASASAVSTCAALSEVFTSPDKYPPSSV